MEQGKDKALKDCFENKMNFTVKDNILCRNKDSSGKLRKVIPEHLVSLFIEKVHYSNLCAHGGIEKTSYYMRSVWFPECVVEFGIIASPWEWIIGTTFFTLESQPIFRQSVFECDGSDAE